MMLCSITLKYFYHKPVIVVNTNTTALIAHHHGLSWCYRKELDTQTTLTLLNVDFKTDEIRFWASRPPVNWYV